MTQRELVGQGRTAEILAWGEGQVLKLFRPGFSSEWVREEAVIGRAVAEAGLAAPAVGDVIEVDGRIGILYERIDGPSMLQVLSARPWSMLSLAGQFVDLQIAMHQTAAPILPSQRERLAGAIRRAPGLERGVCERLIEALHCLPTGEAVCHGDYHPDNILMSARGPVVVDWANATRGNPLADVARSSLLIGSSTLPPGVGRLEEGVIQWGRAQFHRAYMRTYQKRCAVSPEQVEAWIPFQAAARLNEQVPGEREWLLSLIKTWDDDRDR